ncbi:MULTISPECIES: PhzF family phenazine biosynthesis protein [unclassified Streptomyces]|uniref:PhzF family phenazine biosynthesis protein n=1 Tax=unclassified Streptomyces TaxID=2593676 RepID=UPI001F5B3631|nr:PhzF family phenazine biosynthesis protein [Streptomyces sp. HSG2]
MAVSAPAHDVVRVFFAGTGEQGHRLAIVRDGAALPQPGARRRLAAELGYGQIVFVDDPERGVIDVHTPAGRPGFAGQAYVGTAWLLDVPELVTPAGVMGARQDGEFSWVEARAEWAPAHSLSACASVEEVDATAARAIDAETLAGAPDGGVAPRGSAWAWEDMAAGRVRARVFPGEAAPRDAGRPGPIDGPEASVAALLLTSRLDRALNVVQSAGSQILTAPQPDGWVEIGGRVRLENNPPVRDLGGRAWPHSSGGFRLPGSTPTGIREE